MLGDGLAGDWQFRGDCACARGAGGRQTLEKLAAGCVSQGSEDQINGNGRHIDLPLSTPQCSATQKLLQTV